MNILIEWTLDFQIHCLQIVIMQFYVAMEICIVIHYVICLWIHENAIDLLNVMFYNLYVTWISTPQY